MRSFKEWFAQVGLVAPVPVVQSSSFYASLSMVGRTDMVSLVPETAALAQRDALGLCLLRPPWPNPEIDLVFAARDTHWADPMVAALRACFQQAKTTASPAG